MTHKAPVACLGLVSVLATSVALPTLAQEKTIRTENVSVVAETIAEGLANPWGIDFLPDGAMIVTEKAGTMRIVRDGKLSEPLAGLPEVWEGGQGGLLDVSLAPDFATSSRVYFSYSKPNDGGAGTAVAYGTLDVDGARLDGVKTIFEMEKKTSRGQHFGSRLVFHPDGTLFVTTGDRGQGSRAQDPRDHAGAVHRIDAEGGIPADNPSPDGSKWLASLWSKGHRNPQGAAWDAVTGGLVTVEHGARGGDEINRPEAGKNYGWPEISYGVDYSGAKLGVGTRAAGFEQPLHHWDPSIAPSGLAVYDGAMFPEWKGDLLVGALKFQLVSRLDRDETGKILGEERLFEGEFGRIRDVAVAPDGALVLLTDDTGRIVRISRAD